MHERRKWKRKIKREMGIEIGNMRRERMGGMGRTGERRRNFRGGKERRREGKKKMRKSKRAIGKDFREDGEDEIQERDVRQTERKRERGRIKKRKSTGEERCEKEN